MKNNFIDVWDSTTFDNALLERLRSNENLIRNYMHADERIMIERLRSDRRGLAPTNPYSQEYHSFIDQIMYCMEARVIRAWHYTRLTNDETALIRETGIFPTTIETIRKRLESRFIAGDFSSEAANALFKASPFHQQLDARSNKFWMTSCPFDSDDGGVELLLANWGGEGVYFWLDDPYLKAIVASIGSGRVLELAVPLNITEHTYSAAEAVVASFGRLLGCEPDRDHFDLYIKEAIGPDHVLAIHTDGEENFRALGRGYPPNFKKFSEKLLCHEVAMRWA